MKRGFFGILFGLIVKILVIRLTLPSFVSPELPRFCTRRNATISLEPLDKIAPRSEHKINR